MTKYLLRSEDEKIYRKQLQAFKNDTGFIGIFKQNYGEPINFSEDILGITEKGQLVKISFDKLKRKTQIEW